MGLEYTILGEEGGEGGGEKGSSQDNKKFRASAMQYLEFLFSENRI